MWLLSTRGTLIILHMKMLLFSNNLFVTIQFQGNIKNGKIALFGLDCDPITTGVTEK